MRLGIPWSDGFSNESVISPPRDYRKGIAADDREDCYVTEITVEWCYIGFYTLSSTFNFTEKASGSGLRAKLQNARASIDISQYLVPRTVLTVIACLMSARSSSVTSISPAAQFSIVRLALLFVR